MSETEHNYTQKLFDVAETILNQKAGGFYMISVEHDDNCPKLNEGICNCSPSITTKELIDE